MKIMVLCLMFVLVAVPLARAYDDTIMISPNGGSYTTPQSVGVSGQGAGATVHYTLNGGDPMESDPIYSTPIVVSQTLTLKARAFRAGVASSAVVRADFTIPFTGTALQIKPTYDIGVLSDNTTTDGYCFRTGHSGSAIETIYYQFDLSALPTSPDGATLRINGVEWRYYINDRHGGDTAFRDGLYLVPGNNWTAGTINYGNAPVPTDLVCSWDYQYNANGVFGTAAGPELTSLVQAKANSATDKKLSFNVAGINPTADGWHEYVDQLTWGGGDLSYLEVYYDFIRLVSDVTIDPGGGNFTVGQAVTLSCETSGATIHYTLNGGDPTQADPVYSSPIAASQTLTLKARAFLNGYSSGVTRADFVFPFTGTELEIRPTYDVSVVSNSSIVYEYPASSRLYTGAQAGGISSIYYQFDMSALGPLPPGATGIRINGVKFVGYANAVYGGAAANFQDGLYLVPSNAWDNNTITYATAPAHTDLLCTWDFPAVDSRFIASGPALTSLIQSKVDNATNKVISFNVAGINMPNPSQGSHEYCDKDAWGGSYLMELKVYYDILPVQNPRFVDRTEALGLSGLDSAPADWVDFNNDGWVDLYEGGIIWINHNGTSFTPINLGLGYGVWGDIDNDGYPDFFCYNSLKMYHNNGGTGSMTEVTIPTLPMTSCYYGASFADHNNDGRIDLYVTGDEDDNFTPQPDAILRNVGGTSFTMTLPEPTSAIKPGRGVTSCDFDEDGYPDIYVSNYRLEANYLWRNDGLGNFTDMAATYGVAGDYDGWSASYGHTIGSCWGDLDNDGHLDLFVGNFAHSDAYQDRSKFYKNLGPAGSWHFQDMSAGAGLAYQESYASPALGDYDNDGNLDLFFTTAYSGDHSVLYRNNGNWTFADVTDAEGLGGLGPTYHQAAWADFDHDGKLDLVTGGKLFVNTGATGNWLEVRLRSNTAAVNRDAIGAQVRVSVGGQTLTRQVEAGTGEGNENDFTLHFGLGSNSGPVNLEIRWPDHTATTLSNVAVNQMIVQDRSLWLAVASADGLAASGYQGGPFSSSVKTYTLTNTANQSLSWTASSPSWITVSPAGGTLAPGTSVSVTASVNATANALAAGSTPYTGTISFTNTTNGNGNTGRSASLIVQPVLKGAVVLDDFAASPATVACFVQLWRSGSLYRTMYGTLSSQGGFRVTNVPVGTYTVKILAPHWLARTIANVQMTATGADVGTVHLVNGDADGDNEVTATDLSIVLAAMDSSAGGLADLNGDGIVNSTDLAIVLTNLDRLGD